MIDSLILWYNRWLGGLFPLLMVYGWYFNSWSYGFTNNNSGASFVKFYLTLVEIFFLWLSTLWQTKFDISIIRMTWLRRRDKEAVIEVYMRRCGFDCSYLITISISDYEKYCIIYLGYCKTGWMMLKKWLNINWLPTPSPLDAKLHELLMRRWYH